MSIQPAVEDPRFLPGQIARPADDSPFRHAVELDDVAACVAPGTHTSQIGLVLSGTIAGSADRARITVTYDQILAAKVIAEIARTAARFGPDFATGFMDLVEQQLRCEPPAPPPTAAW
jgi:hypothetical protein